MRHRVFFAIAVLGALFSPAIIRAQTHCLKEDHHAGGESVMHLWTGPQNGYYYHVGKAIEAASKHMPDEIRIHTCSSNGSATNLAALLKNEADFAIVQSDLAHQLWHCEVPDRQRCESQKEPLRIRLVTPLFVEKVQVLVRPHLYVSSLGELRSSHCIWAGIAGSGSAPTARMLLEAAGWSQDQIPASQSGCHSAPKTLEEALVLLERGGDLDAIIQTRVVPSRPIYEALKNSEIQIMGIDWNMVERMSQDGIYRETSIQRSEYHSAGEGVYTVGVAALLLTRNNADVDAVRAMAELIEDEQADIEKHLQRNLLFESGAKGDLDSDTGKLVDGEMIGPATLTLVGSKVPDELAAHVDPEAKPYLWPWSIRRGAFIRLAILLAALTVIGAVLNLHSRDKSRVGRYYREVLFVFSGILVWAFAALWLQSLEGDLNEHYTTLWASAVSLAENVLAKLPLQFSFAPAPTTRNARAVVSDFSYLVVTLVTVYLLPWLRRSWPRFRPAFWGFEPRQSARAATEPKESAQSFAAIPGSSENQKVVG
ncbi:MAG TPA: TAXI family TRAP transporter solute-binding subunit [Candidatus Dormibacteraeota bacterium]|nr:TAXI family TRAP transporter solute-binding subunit [Candidatus Dormibacteraeota bacterium]